jgi:hypothetical protein
MRESWSAGVKVLPKAPSRRCSSPAGRTPAIQASRAARRASSARPVAWRAKAWRAWPAGVSGGKAVKKRIASEGEASSRRSAVRRIAVSPGQPRWLSRKDA